jgi:hypothetical protein
LTSETEARPERVDEAPSDREKSALVTTSMARGSVVLSSPGRRDVALVWNGKADAKRPEPRALPPGKWRVRTTRIERTKAGEHWFLSASSPHGQKLELEAGKPAHVEVAAVVVFNGKAARKGNGLQLGFTITSRDPGGGHRGMSIYKNKKRVPVLYEVRDTDGKVLSSGRMNYG